MFIYVEDVEQRLEQITLKRRNVENVDIKGLDLNQKKERVFLSSFNLQIFRDRDECRRDMDRKI